MAYVSETTSSIGATIANAAHSVSTAFTTFMLDLYNAGSRADLIQELQSMDDATLRAKHGIARDQIVGYVFRDKLVP